MKVSPNSPDSPISESEKSSSDLSNEDPSMTFDPRFKTSPVSQNSPDELQQSGESKRAKILMETKEFITSVMPGLFVTSVFLKLMWALVYISFMGLTITQSVTTLVEYYSHPVTTTVTVKSDPKDSEFPAVTICNNNIARKSYIARVKYLQDLAWLDDYVRESLKVWNSEGLDINTTACEKAGLYVCDNGMCINKAWVCNNVSECSDATDEAPYANCSEYETRNISEICEPGFTLCPNEHTCSVACDGVPECVENYAYDESNATGCNMTCRQDIQATELEQVLTSVNYPNAYPENLDCEYRITGPAKSKIQIHITVFDLEKENNCQYDHFQVLDGIGSSVTAIKINGKRKACGSLDDLGSSTTVTSSSNKATIKFYSDPWNIDENKGWSLTFTALTGTSSTRIKRQSNSEDYDYDYDYDYNQEGIAGSGSGNNFAGLKPYDWFGAFQRSNMPDYSDFKAFLNLQHSEIVGNGHQLNDFIVQCVMDGSECLMSAFMTKQYAEFGNCFSLNAVTNVDLEDKKDQFKPYRTARTGSEHGLKMTLFLDKDEYLGITGQKSGARLTISNAEESPPLQSHAIFISAGAATIISLNQDFVKRQKAPFSECVESWPSFLNLRDNYKRYTYTVDHCYSLCTQQQLAYECGCSQLASEWNFTNDDFVANMSQNQCNLFDSEQSKCVRQILDDYTLNRRSCSCPSACQQRRFHLETSTTEWPTEAYAPYLVSLLQRSTSRRVRDFVTKAIADSNKGQHTDILKDVLKKNFARVEIHFATHSYYIVEESPKYKLQDLFGTLGGNLGLWLGWSIMAGFEMIQWVYNCVWIAASK